MAKNDSLSPPGVCGELYARTYTTSVSDILHISIITCLEQQGFMSRNVEPETCQK